MRFKSLYMFIGTNSYDISCTIHSFDSNRNISSARKWHDKYIEMLNKSVISKSYQNYSQLADNNFDTILNTFSLEGQCFTRYYIFILYHKITLLLNVQIYHRHIPNIF